ncbi:MAG: hypothetical protein OXE86_15540 [Alphaproteobacteria bacterium]|nr:hypothetical protein [Alphaproteobacteria bacterium]
MSGQADHLTVEAARYVVETRQLSDIGSSTEKTFYPAIRDLIAAILRAQNLPFEVRTGTSESKQAGTERPDFILADSGLFAGVFGEVKNPMKRSKTSRLRLSETTRPAAISTGPAR